MPRLIDENKAKEVLTDYYHIRTNIQQIAMEEAFSRVPTVEAIPVEWIRNKYREKWEKPELGRRDFQFCEVIDELLEEWEKENAKID